MHVTINRVASIAALMLLLLVSAVGGMGFWSARSSLDNMVALERSAALVQRHMESDMKHDALRGDVAAILAARDATTGISKRESEAELQQHMAEFRTLVAQADALATDPETKAAHDKIKVPLAAYLASAAQMQTYIDTDPIKAGVHFPEFNRTFENLQSAMDESSKAIEASAGKIRMRSDGQAAFNFKLSIVTLLLALVALMALVAGVRRKLVNPLKELADVTEAMAQGHIESHIPLQDRADEIGVLARAIDSFRLASIEKTELEVEAARQRAAQAEAVEALGGALTRLAEGDLAQQVEEAFPPEYERLRHDFNRAIGSLATTLTSVVDVLRALRTAAGEISTASGDLAMRTEQQAASLEETAVACSQVTGAVQDAAADSGAAERMAREAHGDALQGGAVVRDAIAAMEAIEKSSHEIGQIISVIDGIAFQTNLLALNAGVEAARAGDAGKGFAVVANEVRALAQRSGDASRQIRDLITLSREQVESGVQLVDRTGEALQRIVERVDGVSSMIRGIAASSHNQAVNLQQVNVAVSTMDGMTQQNAAMVEQTTAAGRSLIDQADTLAELISAFKLGNQPATGRRTQAHQSVRKAA